MKRLLLLGTGSMAAKHAEAFAALGGVSIVACCDTRPEAATVFAGQHDIPEVFADLDEALAEGGFDAMINCTPDKAHHPTTMQAMRSGLSVFCEKPLALNAADAFEMAQAAQDRNLVNGVNLTYRNVAALQRARQLVSERALGDIRHFEASYLQSWLTQPAWGDWRTDPKWLWRLSSEHGSTGVLGDVGIHILDFLSFAAGLTVSGLGARLNVFEKAEGNRVGEYKLDANDSAVMTVELENGASGVVHASRFASGHLNDLSLQLFGTKGGLRVTNRGPLGSLEVSLGSDMLSGDWQAVELDPVLTNYQKFAQALVEGRDMDPDFAWAARLQLVMDTAFEAHRTDSWQDVVASP